MSYNNDNQFNTTQIEPDYDSYVSCNDERTLQMISYLLTTLTD